MPPDLSKVGMSASVTETLSVCLRLSINCYTWFYSRFLFLLFTTSLWLLDGVCLYWYQSQTALTFRHQQGTTCNLHIVANMYVCSMYMRDTMYWQYRKWSIISIVYRGFGNLIWLLFICYIIRLIIIQHAGTVPCGDINCNRFDRRFDQYQILCVYLCYLCSIGCILIYQVQTKIFY